MSFSRVSRPTLSRLEGKSRGLRRHGTHCRCRQLNWSRNRGRRQSVRVRARGGECVVDDAPAGQWPDGAKAGRRGTGGTAGGQGEVQRRARLEVQTQRCRWRILKLCEQLKEGRTHFCWALFTYVSRLFGALSLSRILACCAPHSRVTPRFEGQDGQGWWGPGAWGCSSRTTWHWQPFFSALLEPTALHLQLSGTETRLHSTSPSSSSPQQRCLLVANNELTLETLGEAVPSHPSANTAKGTTVERLLGWRHDGQIFPLGPTLPYHLAAVRSHPSCRIRGVLFSPTTSVFSSKSLSLTPPFPPPLPPSAVQPLSPTLGGAIHPRNQMGPSSPREQKSPNCPACQVQGEAQGARAGRSTARFLHAAAKPDKQDLARRRLQSLKPLA